MIQQTIREVERSMGDEFYVRKYHEANTYTLLLAMYLLLVSCIAIAAISPNPWVSFVPWAAIVLASFVGSRRMRREVPTPVMPKPFSSAMIKQSLAILMLTIVWIATIAWKIDGEFSILLGGLVVGVAVLLIAPAMSRKQHERDTARIEARLED